MDDYVSKPIRLPALVTALEHGAADSARRAQNEMEPSTPSTNGTSGTDSMKGSKAAIGAAQNGTGARDEAIAKTVLALSGGDDEFLQELVGTFLEDAPKLLRQLRTAVEAGDANTVRLLAHGLKSNGAEFGASAFSEQCKDLEAMGRSGQLDGAAALLARIEAEYPHVAATLQDVIAQPRLAPA
jgi:HPt (histidine-containing phosphotransfer) domain-containing protein